MNLSEYQSTSFPVQDLEPSDKCDGCEVVLNGVYFDCFFQVLAEQEVCFFFCEDCESRRKKKVFDVIWTEEIIRFKDEINQKPFQAKDLVSE